MKEWSNKTNATVIAFWIPRELPNMPAFTTNVEFGYWLHSGKVVYGRPDEASKIKYLDWLYKLDYNKEPCNDLATLLSSSFNIANSLYSEYESEILPLNERKMIKKIRK